MCHSGSGNRPGYQARDRGGKERVGLVHWKLLSRFVGKRLSLSVLPKKVSVVSRRSTPAFVYVLLYLWMVLRPSHSRLRHCRLLHRLGNPPHADQGECRRRKTDQAAVRAHVHIQAVLEQSAWRPDMFKTSALSAACTRRVVARAICCWRAPNACVSHRSAARTFVEVCASGIDFANFYVVFGAVCSLASPVCLTIRSGRVHSALTMVPRTGPPSDAVGRAP